MKPSINVRKSKMDVVTSLRVRVNLPSATWESFNNIDQGSGLRQVDVGLLPCIET